MPVQFPAPDDLEPIERASQDELQALQLVVTRDGHLDAVQVRCELLPTATLSAQEAHAWLICARNKEKRGKRCTPNPWTP